LTRCAAWRERGPRMQPRPSELVLEGTDGCIWKASVIGVLLPTRFLRKPELVLELDPRKLKAPEPPKRAP